MMANSLPGFLDTIEADVRRLEPLLLYWPPLLPTLNAARNFVQHFCRDFGFEYTGWPGVEMGKFRLYVHFNTAKHALEAGKFRVKEQPDAAALGKTGRAEEKNGHERGQEEGVGLHDAGVELWSKRIKMSTAPYAMHGKSSFNARATVREDTVTIDDQTSFTSDVTAADAFDDGAPRSTTSIHQVRNPFEQLEERLARVREKFETIEFQTEGKQDPFKVS
jgi:hypothetical protein